MKLLVKSKGKILLRILGSLLILSSFFYIIIFDFYAVKFDEVNWILIIIIPLTWFTFFLFQKIENKHVRRHEKLIRLAIAMIQILITVIYPLFINQVLTFYNILFIEIYELMLLITWYFSYSIYKKLKIISLIAIIFNVLFLLLFSMTSLSVLAQNFNYLLALLISILGFTLIIFIELIMKMKKEFRYR